MKKSNLALIYILLLFGLAIVPFGSSTVLTDNYVVHVRGDYFLHALVYIPLPFLLANCRGKAPWCWLKLFFLSLAIACGFEALQLLLSYRSFNINDMFGNGAGVILGFLLLPLLQGFWHFAIGVR